MAKKKNKNRNKKFWILLVIGVILYIFFAIIFLYQKKVSTYQKITIPTLMPTSSLAQYHSEFLKIRFSVSAGFYIRELHNDITIKNDVGEISILRNGTNDDSIEGYLFDISDRGRGRIQIINKQKTKINGLDVISCDIKSLVNNEPEGKYYYFYSAPGTVFIITTSTPELFGELDQIAQSFRYEP
jgi:hypothetical protein